MVAEWEVYIVLQKQWDADEMQRLLVDSQLALDALLLSDQSNFESVALQTAGSKCEHLPGIYMTGAHI